MAATGMLSTIIVAKDPTGMIDQFLLDPGMELQELLQVVVFIEIPLAVDQFGLAAKVV